uniref:Uncharacterized protein n=1 Tax=Sphaerodactylus townsendi TaxID=933632 RepID=A0ACB8FKN8_9SAUR
MICHLFAFISSHRITPLHGKVELDLVLFTSSQGYEKRLREIFEEATFFKSTREAQMEPKKTLQRREFESLEKCNEEYQRLSKDIQKLKDLLTQHGAAYEVITSRNSDPKHTVPKGAPEMTVQTVETKVEAYQHGEAGPWNNFQ